MIDLKLGDCLEVMKTMEDNSVDAIVTDPPYGLSFMGKKWDYDVPSQEIWEEALRVLKPGGYLLAFAGTRTQHRMACRIEDAGFEIRDMIAWVYGSGFPKSLNIGKQIDKIQCNEREVIGTQTLSGNAAQTTKEKGGTYASNTNAIGVKPIEVNITKGTSQWEGWGTALKPALEPITVARKPIEGTVANNVLKWGVGGINIDECRVGTEEINIHNAPRGTFAGGEPDRGSDTDSYRNSIGRFPANLIHDGSDEAVELLSDSQRFFYCAKTSKSERNAGCDELEEQIVNDGRETDIDNAFQRGITLRKNTHPTVKPIALMKYLIKLVSKENYVILDPFMGSGSTGIACKQLDRQFIGIELDKDYMEIAKKRIDSVKDDDQLTIFDI